MGKIIHVHTLDKTVTIFVDKITHIWEIYPIYGNFKTQIFVTSGEDVLCNESRQEVENLIKNAEP